MIRIRKSDERGHFHHGWLDTYHTFSFDQYYDPNFMGFRSLRVINEDRVQPGMGFPTHPHRDMEILTYLLAGALQHRDSMGTGSIIRPGELQRMSAGTGITHSEFNASRTEPVHLLQIWLLPERKGLKPSYEQKAFPEAERRGRLRLVASHDGRDGSLTVHQDVSLYAGLLEPGQKVTHRLEPGRSAWVQVARGKVHLNGSALEAGDGAAISKQQEIELGSEDVAEILLFDLA
jgi:redox-sensitive bicupin YhaK (pirin superfamily)